MRAKSLLVFLVIVFCVFALMLCSSKREMAEEEEGPVVKAQTEEGEISKEDGITAKTVFSSNAEDYLLSKDWKTNPKKSLSNHLLKLKTQLEENYSEAGQILAKLGARMEDDSEIMNLISGNEISEFFKRYPNRKLVFEIRHVFVDQISEKKYILVENEKSEIDMMAHVIFKYRLVEEEKGINQSGSGSFSCPHRNICEW